MFHSRYWKHEYNPNGTGIFERDWDNLIILDACRYDLYEQIIKNQMGGNLQKRETLASATYRFIPANFSGKTLYDIVYIGGNNWFLKLRDEINAALHRFIDLQQNADVEFAVPQLNVAKPESVTEQAINAAETYPHKRLIVHYLQPHHPFIGEFGHKHFQANSTSLSEVVTDANAGRNLVRKAYVENLKIVLKEVRELLRAFNGRTVITADHGEMLGDRHDYIPMQDYGHHRHIWNDATVVVPWHVFDTGERKQIISEEPNDQPDVDHEKVKENLRNLGYRV